MLGSDSRFEVTRLPAQAPDAEAASEPARAPPAAEPGLLLQGRWRLLKERPLCEDDSAIVYRALDSRDTSVVAVKVYKDAAPLSLQRFRKSVELLLTFRGRFNEKGGRIEGSQNLDVVLEELKAQISMSDYAAAHSFVSQMNFRSCFAELITFSHDSEWNPAADPETGLLFIVMEKGEMSLRQRMNDCIHAKSCFEVDEILQIHWALVSIVCGLFTEGYMNLALSPSNVFCFRDARGREVWKLTDLDGVVRTGSQMRLVDIPYVPEYAPPELAQLYLRGQREGGRIRLDRKMNVWSAGMCALEALSLMPVFDVKYSWYQKWRQTKGGSTNFMASLAGEKMSLGTERMIPADLLEAMQALSPEMTQVVEAMLVKEPKQRASITQCLMHGWFEAKRKVVVNARWGIDDDSEEEEALGADGKRKRKRRYEEEVEASPLPGAERPEDLRAYIKAQLAGEPPAARPVGAADAAAAAPAPAQGQEDAKGDRKSCVLM